MFSFIDAYYIFNRNILAARNDVNITEKSNLDKILASLIMGECGDVLSDQLS